MTTSDTTAPGQMTAPACTGRFAPSPSGRMHLGNMFAALLSWLSARSQGGRWILRIEDLDPQRSRDEYAHQIEEDLLWLGLDWDEGGMADRGPHGPYRQSLRQHCYEQALERLRSSGLTYPCRCTRADIMATQAPHQSDGRVVYAGTCRPKGFPDTRAVWPGTPCAERLYVPEGSIEFTDRLFGPQSVDLAAHCGDFVLRRADGAWAYQLAVVVDDALMGVTEVVRGCDLLMSSAQQIYLYRLLGHTPPEWMHVPLLCNTSGQRLAKRDRGLNAGELRNRHTPQELTGILAHLAGIIPEPYPCTPTQLIPLYSPALLPRGLQSITVNNLL